MINLSGVFKNQKFTRNTARVDAKLKWVVTKQEMIKGISKDWRLSEEHLSHGCYGLLRVVGGDGELEVKEELFNMMFGYI